MNPNKRKGKMVWVLWQIPKKTTLESGSTWGTLTWPSLETSASILFLTVPNLQIRSLHLGSLKLLTCMLTFMSTTQNGRVFVQDFEREDLRFSSPYSNRVWWWWLIRIRNIKFGLETISEKNSFITTMV